MLRGCISIKVYLGIYWSGYLLRISQDVTHLFLANFRGDGAYCYHQPCDNIEHYLTEDNVNFLGKTSDTIAQVIHNLSEPHANKSNGTFVCHFIDFV